MKLTLGLSMIVRNGGQDLQHCLESVRGIADEIVIADTGSTDDTVKIAQSFGATVIRVPWKKDFAAARNAALKAMTADWVLSLDADEQLDAQAATQIAAAMQARDVAGYTVTIRNYVHSLTERLWDKSAIANDARLPRAAHFAGYLEHENVRLFRNRPEIFFEGRVHETVGTRIQAGGGKLEHADFIIHHFGFTASPEKKQEKNRFYRDLGRQKIKEMPDNAQAYFELGLVELDNFHNNEEAERLFERASSLNKKLAVAWFFRGIALSRLQRDADALESLSMAKSLGINTTALAEAEGDAFYNCKRLNEARQAYRRALQMEQSMGVLSKLGLTEYRLKQFEPGLKKLKSAILMDPSIAEVHDRLVAALLSGGRVDDAARAGDAKLQAVTHTPSLFIRAAALWMHAKDNARAAQIVRQGIEEFPDSAELRQACKELKVAISENSHTPAEKVAVVKGIAY
jgi:glycosyltransferase involved in cell wall biosynthesis